MHKGTTIENTTRMLGYLRDAGIAVEILSFTGFPGDTREDALETIDYLRRNPTLWAIGGTGRFQLLPRSSVARSPEAFGTTVTPPAADEILIGYLHTNLWQQEDDVYAISEAASVFQRGAFSRPWAGAVDTPHTMMFFDRFGPGFASLLEGAITGAKLVARGEQWTIPAALRAEGEPEQQWRTPEGYLLPLSGRLLHRLRLMDGTRTIDDIFGLADAQDHGRSLQLIQALRRARAVQRPRVENLEDVRG